jgi:hypothetical protein
MDMRDKELDSWIQEALQQGTALASPRKNHAWDRIRQQAQQQIMLAPAPVIERRSLALQFAAVSRVFWNWAATLAVDEAHYERAHQKHLAMRYGGPSRDGRLVLQFMNPTGFNIMSPAF